MKLDPQDVALCLGHDEDLPSHRGAVMPPIYQSSLFVQESFEQLAQGLAAEHAHFVYTRGRNPTVAELERKLARLEQGDAAIAFASGIGAIAAIFFAILSRGITSCSSTRTMGRRSSWPVVWSASASNTTWCWNSRPPRSPRPCGRTPG